MPSKASRFVIAFMAASQVAAPLLAHATSFEVRQGVKGLVVTQIDPLTEGSGEGAPIASVSANNVSFGSLPVGSTSLQTIRLFNTGTSVLTLTSAPALTGSLAFTFPVAGGTNCGSSLAVGSYCDITIQFSPSDVSEVTGALDVATNAANSPLRVSLAGSGESVLGSLAPASGSSANFGAVGVGATEVRSFVFTNNSRVALSGVYTYLAGNDPLVIQPGTCGTSLQRTTLAAAESCTFSVAYTPSSGVALSTAIRVYSSAQNSPAALALTGSGVVTNLVASGGTVGSTMQSGAEYRWHTFSSDGSFTITSAPAGATLTVAMVGGGGGGGYDGGGGGGGGSAQKFIVPAVSGATYSVVLGQGGTGATVGVSRGGTGGTTYFGAYSVAGGGGGASKATAGGAGFNGGGAGHSNGAGAFSGGANSLGAVAGGSVSAGFAGGAVANSANGGGGGGGISGAGGAGSSTGGGDGGAGDTLLATNIMPYVGCGGGGGTYLTGSSFWGACGSTALRTGGTSSRGAAAGPANTGSGGGGGGHVGAGYGNGAPGGSGLVVVYYKY